MIARKSAGLLGALQAGIELGRVVLYKGIDAHNFLPRFAASLAELAVTNPTPSGSFAEGSRERPLVVDPAPQMDRRVHLTSQPDISPPGLGLIQDPQPKEKGSRSAINAWVKHASDTHSEFRCREEALNFGKIYQHGTRMVAYRLSGVSPTPDLAELLDWMKDARGWTGWRPWWVPTREGIRPHVRNGLIECCIHHSDNPQPCHADYWLASRDGCFFLMTGLDEDSAINGSTPPKTVFSTALPFWRLGECIYHAVQMAQRFNARSADFHVLYTGLYGRQLQYWPDRFGARMSLGHSHEHSAEIAFSADMDDALASVNGLCDLLVRELKPVFEIFDFAKVSRDAARSTLTEMLERGPR